MFTTARLDQAVDSVTGPGIRGSTPGSRGRGSNLRGQAPVTPPAEPGTRVYLSNRREMVMPAELRLTYDDGTNDVVRLPVEIWNLGSRFTYTVSAQGKRVVKAELDPRHVWPDVDRANNVWPRGR